MFKDSIITTKEGKVGEKMGNQTKKIISLIATVLSIGIVSYALQKNAIAESTGIDQKENQTIQIYKKLLRGKSEKEINDYFGNLPDSKVIIADESGGFTTSSTDDYSNPVEIIDERGNKELKSFQDTSTASTIGEIKAAMKINK